MCKWFVRKHIMFWRLWVTWEYYTVVKISCLSFFYPVAKLKPHLNPAYCLDRGFVFLPGHLNFSGEKEDYVTAITLNSLSPTSSGPLVLCSSFSIFTCLSVAAAAKSLQSCPTPSDPMDCSLQGSSFRGVFQARVLEWVAIAFSVSLKS